MKLRIKGNSIRLRLTQREVEQLGTEGVVEEAVHLGGSNAPFIYGVRTSHDDFVTARFDGRQINVSIPLKAADDWIHSDEVGIETVQTTGDEKGVRILVEKDFACLTERSGEDESDAYPHPMKAVGC